MESKKAAKRRIRSPHPGVVLIKPTGAYTSWRARYRDPDTEKLTWTTLDPTELRTSEARRDWCVAKSKSIAKREMDLASGAVRKTGVELSVAVERYYKAHPRLRSRTLSTYKSATKKLLDWARLARVETADQLTRGRLMTFRDELTGEKKSAMVKGQKGRKARTKTRSARRPATVNRELRTLHTVLTYLRRSDLLPYMTGDDLSDSLKQLPSDHERMDFLRPAQIKQLLEAAQRHDADKHTETRAEHRGEGAKGTTVKYEPIAPFVLFVLLSGCRLGEALGLTWADVDLESVDALGNVMGSVHLTPTATKTHKPREVAFDCSPSLLELLKAMGGTEGSVFGLTQGEVDAAAKRLRSDYGAPKFSFQGLRRTCGTYLTCAPGIFGAASAFMSSRRLGHSVQVAERHYVGVLRGIPPSAKTLEAAMQIEGKLMDGLLAT